MMDMKSHLIDMANYHKWAYQKLCAKLDNLSDEDYYKDCGLFFRSIHITLNHLLLVDTLWLSRFKRIDYSVSKLDTELCHDRQEIKQLLIEQANSWIMFVSQLNNPPEKLDYKQINGTPLQRPYLSTIAHVFNHGTHHRGQITAVIAQLGAPTPELDFSNFLLG